MPAKLNAIKISETVYWVGAIDWNVRNFHGYATSRGTTYNAFLIMSDKITLIDTVKHGFEDEMIARISSVIDPKKINYIVSNHAEPDHSGGLPKIIKAIEPMKVFASTAGVKALDAHFGDMGIHLTPVKDGEEITLGHMTLKFLETKMLHWPDSMFSYLVEEKMLFSQDAFGMHLASSERFDDEFDWGLLERQSRDYYSNIITLYSPHVLKLIDRVGQLGLEFKVICPDHGPVWRNMENFGKELALYKKWASRELIKKAVIVYDTMWHSTELMAKYIESGISSTGVKVETMSLASNNRSDIAFEMIDAAALVVGSPTLNNNIFPSVADVLTYLRGLKFQTPFGGVFGSYGWSGESIKQTKEYLASMNCEVVGEVKSNYVPKDEVLEECFKLGVSIGEKINQKF